MWPTAEKAKLSDGERGRRVRAVGVNLTGSSLSHVKCFPSHTLERREIDADGLMYTLSSQTK